MTFATSGNDCLPSEEYGVISGLIGASLEPVALQELLKTVLDRLGTVSWLDLDGRGAILLLNSRNQLVMVAQRGFSEARAALCEKVDLDRCGCGHVVGNPEGAVLPCEHDSPRDGSEPGTKSYHFVLPLVARGRVIGTLPLFLAHEQQFNEAQLGFLRDLGRLLSSTVFQQLTEEMVEVRELERQEARSEIIDKLGMASEYRDQETGMHVLRMKEYAGAIARNLGMPPEDREQLIATAPMHDVGKIGIPDEILLKPGKLSAQEFEVMRGHTRIGNDILTGDDPMMREAREIALTHHEKWDGSGYPRGLEGEDIPLFGRICAVADVFDALTSERPYKDAWPVERAVDLIRGGAGTDFDPAIVSAFMGVLPEAMRIRELYRDNVIDPHEKLDLPPVPVSADAWLSWNDSLSVGIDVIDEHHRYLIDLTNELHAAVTGGHGSKAVGRTLRALERYTHVHFREEERLMRQYGFPRLAEHRSQHELFCIKIAGFWEEIKVSPLTLGHETALFLKQWLVHHVTVEDARLREIHLLAALQRMLALMAVADGPSEDTEIAVMAQVYTRVAESDLGEEQMVQAIEEAKGSSESPAEYLKGVADNLSDDFKATLIEAARLVATAHRLTGDRERKFLDELADALGMPEAGVDGTVS